MNASPRDSNDCLKRHLIKKKKKERKKEENPPRRIFYAGWMALVPMWPSVPGPPRRAPERIIWIICSSSLLSLPTTADNTAVGRCSWLLLLQEVLLARRRALRLLMFVFYGFLQLVGCSLTVFFFSRNPPPMMLKSSKSMTTTMMKRP